MLLNEIEDLMRERKMHVDAITNIDAQVNGAFEILNAVVGRAKPQPAQPKTKAARKRNRWTGEGSRLEQAVLNVLANGAEMTAGQLDRAVGSSAKTILFSMVERGLLIKRTERHSSPGRPYAYYGLASPAVTTNGHHAEEEIGLTR